MFFMFSENLSVVLGTCIFKKILKLFLLPFFNLRMVPSGFSLRIRDEERHEGHFMDYPAQRLPDKAK